MHGSRTEDSADCARRSRLQWPLRYADDVANDDGGGGDVLALVLLRHVERNGREEIFFLFGSEFFFISFLFLLAQILNI